MVRTGEVFALVKAVDAAMGESSDGGMTAEPERLPSLRGRADKREPLDATDARVKEEPRAARESKQGIPWSLWEKHRQACEV